MEVVDVMHFSVFFNANVVLFGVLSERAPLSPWLVESVTLIITTAFLSSEGFHTLIKAPHAQLHQKCRRESTTTTRSLIPSRWPK